MFVLQPTIVNCGDTWDASALASACFIPPVIFTLAGNFYLAKRVCIFEVFLFIASPTDDVVSLSFC